MSSRRQRGSAHLLSVWLLLAAAVGCQRSQSDGLHAAELWPAIRLGLAHGGALCVWMTVIIVGSLRHDPRIWQHDAPAAVRERLGPISDATRRRRRLWTAAMLVGFLLVASSLVVGIDGFLPRLVATTVAFELFNVFDAFVIDILMLLVWAPDWAFPAEVRDHPAFRDWRFHLRNFALGTVGGVLIGLIVAAIAAALEAGGLLSPGG